MPFNILLETVDPQMLDQIPPESVESLNIDLTPVEDKIYDAAFVYEKVDKPITFKVRKNNCIFIPGEPETIKGFSSAFVRQFDHMLSFRQDLNQIHKIGNTPCLTPWRVGLDEELEKSGSPRHIRTVQEARDKKIEKSKFMSMIVSDKTGTPMQRARLKLAKVLSEHYPGLVDIYGRGHNPIKDKAEALDPYLFSIGIENSMISNYMTEKLTDCFVTATVPLYSGCLNLEMYYGGGVIPIDIWDTEGVIKQIIDLRQDATEHYNKLLPCVLASRESLFTRHSIIARIHYFVNTHVSIEIEEKTLIPDTVSYFW